MPSVDGSVRKLYQEFEKEALRCELPGILVLFGEQLYLLPEAFSLKGLKVLRPGLHLGTIKKNRFEPAHALALALMPHEAVRCCSLDVQEAGDYLKGAVFERKGEKGWQLMLADGYSIGWGKLAGGMVKNHYPKGLRKSI
ncbi:ribosomal RNA small subunit methyltransferase F [Lachnospiraceae bacterium]|nr:ribosomal RNA small subunit methyltransferase F [Lachnospiraceae bacterium]